MRSADQGGTLANSFIDTIGAIAQVDDRTLLLARLNACNQLRCLSPRTAVGLLRLFDTTPIDPSSELFLRWTAMRAQNAANIARLDVNWNFKIHWNTEKYPFEHGKDICPLLSAIGKNLREQGHTTLDML